jgi:hypothetical protein
LGERLLCKQEVVGSIPSGSTSRDRAFFLISIIPDLDHRDFESKLIVELFEAWLVRRTQFRAVREP